MALDGPRKTVSSGVRTSSRDAAASRWVSGKPAVRPATSLKWQWHAIFSRLQRNPMFTTSNPSISLTEPIEQYVDGELGTTPTEAEVALMEQLGEVNVVVGGPPCQGNSNLNNHTRGRPPQRVVHAHDSLC